MNGVFQIGYIGNLVFRNCHGVGGNHVKNPQPGYGQVTKANCLTWHTSENSPNFDYDAYFPKILHEIMH